MNELLKTRRSWTPYEKENIQFNEKTATPECYWNHLTVSISVKLKNRQTI